MCSAKKNNNNDRLDSIAEELKGFKQVKKTTPKKRTTRISIKTVAKKGHE